MWPVLAVTVGHQQVIQLPPAPPPPEQDAPRRVEHLPANTAADGGCLSKPVAAIVSRLPVETDTFGTFRTCQVELEVGTLTIQSLSELKQIYLNHTPSSVRVCSPDLASRSRNPKPYTSLIRKPSTMVLAAQL